jgi:quercetin dioxygenase-like cupin family protein
MATGLPGFGRRFYVVGSLALSVMILASGLIFASRPLAGSGEEVRELFSKELPNVPGKALTAVQVDYDPGGTSKPHHHSGVVFAYVVSGEIRSQVDNAPPRVYHAGKTFFEDLGAHHLISENANTSEPARLLAVFVADQGAVLTTDDR